VRLPSGLARDKDPQRRQRRPARERGEHGHVAQLPDVGALGVEVGSGVDELGSGAGELSSDDGKDGDQDAGENAGGHGAVASSDVGGLGTALGGVVGAVVPRGRGAACTPPPGRTGGRSVVAVGSGLSGVVVGARETAAGGGLYGAVPSSSA
jgi:hypothetical protein